MHKLIEYPAKPSDAERKDRMIRKLFTIPVAILLVAGNAAYAATFLHIESIPGSSKAPDHIGWLDVVSLSAPSATQATVVRNMDSASPNIAQAVANGKIFSTVLVDQVVRGRIFRVTMTNVRIASYNVHGSTKAGDTPLEDFTLNAESGSSGFLGQDRNKLRRDKPISETSAQRKTREPKSGQ